MKDRNQDSQHFQEKEIFKRISDNLYADAISDILDEMGFRDQVISPSLGIRPLHAGQVIVGRALTLLNDIDSQMENPYELAIEAMDRMQPGQILVASGKVPLETGIFGELSATRVKEVGGTGAIINGYSRDGRKILEMDFPLFCKGISPIDTTGRVRVIDHNCPIKMGEHTIKPGQIIFADYDGIVLIPEEAEQETIAKSLERAAIESEVRRELRRGATMDEVWNKYHVL